MESERPLCLILSPAGETYIFLNHIKYNETSLSTKHIQSSYVSSCRNLCLSGDITYDNLCCANIYSSCSAVREACLTNSPDFSVQSLDLSVIHTVMHLIIFLFSIYDQKWKFVSEFWPTQNSDMGIWCLFFDYSLHPSARMSFLGILDCPAPGCFHFQELPWPVLQSMICNVHNCNGWTDNRFHLTKPLQYGECQ